MSTTPIPSISMSTSLRVSFMSHESTPNSGKRCARSRCRNGPERRPAEQFWGTCSAGRVPLEELRGHISIVQSMASHLLPGGGFCSLCATRQRRGDASGSWRDRGLWQHWGEMPRPIRTRRRRKKDRDPPSLTGGAKPTLAGRSQQDIDVEPTQTFESLVELAKRHGASDLHLEPGLPPTLRVDGALRLLGEPLSPLSVATMARTILGDQHRAFVERCSADLSRTVHGVRLRINVLKSIRGVGLAVRLLAGFQPTLARLNLLPDLGEVVEASNGLVLVCGPTGSGKSSTLAALIQRLNETSALH